MNRPTEDRAIVDAGLKALAFDSWPAARLRRARRNLRACLRRAWKARHFGRHHRLNIGDKIRLIPGHCDPTVNLYDGYVGIRGNRVEQLWQITARGAVY